MRKVETVIIEAEGRDKGKAFILTELPASEAEDWATRALFALMNAGVQVPDNLAEAGLVGVAAMGLDALKRVSYEAAKPLLDAMKPCIQIKMAIPRELVESDIEEAATWFFLRKKVLALHMDFSMAAVLSTSGQDAARKTDA